MVTFDELFTGGYQYRISADGQSGGDEICNYNSAGGVSAFGIIRNSGTKTVKYVILTSVTPINTVGDPVCCTITGRSETMLTFTGPLAPGEKTARIQWENLWYNRTIDHMRLGDIKVIYTDGTEETILYTKTDDAILRKEKDTAVLKGFVPIFIVILILMILLWGK